MRSNFLITPHHIVSRRIAHHGNNNDIALIALKIVHGADNKPLILFFGKAVELLVLAFLFDKPRLISVSADDAGTRALVDTFCLINVYLMRRYLLLASRIKRFQKGYRNLRLLFVDL